MVGRVQARPTQGQFAGVFFGGFDELGKIFDPAAGGHDQGVGRVVEPKHRGDVSGFVLHLALDGLKHNVRQVDAHHVEAISWQVVHLRPHQGTTGTGLVLNNGFDGRAFFAQHCLLVAGR